MQIAGKRHADKIIQQAAIYGNNKDCYFIKTEVLG